MLVLRYLAKEVFITFVALVGILMSIIMTNQLALYLNRASRGSIPGVLILKLMWVELPSYMIILFPFGFYLSIILALGRMYSENEMVVLQSGGLRVKKLLIYTLILASFVASLVVYFEIINPGAAAKRARLLNSSGMKAFIQMLSPQQFQTLPDNQVLFVEQMNRNHTSAKGLFIAKKIQESDGALKWQVVSAKELHLEKQKNEVDYLVMENGHLYNLFPGKFKAQLGEFEKAILKIPEIIYNTVDDTRSIPASELWNKRHTSPLLKAEFQWRLSHILMVFVLSYVAVALSPVSPRSGRFSKILPAIIIFLFYISILFKWREYVVYNHGTSASIFLLHGLILSIGAFLFWQQKRRFNS